MNLRRFRVIFVLLTLAAAAPTCPRAASIGDLGAATLFELERLTIVYPGGSEREATNRRSALHRADWLHRRHGIETRVLADDRVAPGDLRGDLLLLGWDNRLLDGQRVARPFERTGDRLEFAGVVVTEPGADLLFFERSPYDPDGFLMFWSRIDPELDRYMVLPALGSDWGIYVDFLPVYQGMFADGSVWPPVRNPYAEKDHRPDLELRRAAEITRDSAHYTLRYRPSVLADEQAARVLDSRETALARAAALLDVEIGGLHLDLHVYDEVESKMRATGVPDRVHSLPRRGQLHMLAPYALSASPHEEIHHLARREFGPAYLTAMYEGLALDLEASERGENLDLQAATLLEREAMPDLDDLLDEGRMAALPGDVSFPSAALLVRWLRESFGEQTIARVYGLGGGGVEAFADALDLKPAKLARRFDRWIQRRASTQRDEIAYLKAMARARELALAADYAAVVEVLGRALEVKPSDPAALLQIAGAEMRVDALDAARAHLQTLLGLQLGEDSPYPARARFELGRVHDLLGERDRAIEEYRRVLEMPDPSDLHLRAREAIDTPVTRDTLL